MQRAMKRKVKNDHMAAREMQITRILSSALDEALAVPVLEEGEAVMELEERQVDIQTLYERIEEMENQDGQLLQDMWRITVTAFYVQDGAEIKRSAVTWRYGRLYQP